MMRVSALLLIALSQAQAYSVIPSSSSDRPASSSLLSFSASSAALAPDAAAYPMPWWATSGTNHDPTRTTGAGYFQTFTDVQAAIARGHAVGSVSLAGTGRALSAAVSKAKETVKSVAAAPPLARQAAPSMTDAQVRALFGLWNDALATLDPHAVAKRYAKDTILLPTVSDTPRKNYASILDYFVNFLKKHPTGEILDSKVIKGDGWCMDAGIYEFLMQTTGDKVRARYSYVYTYDHADQEWKIAHHHSSVMPEAVLPTPVSEPEIRMLFNKWNAALATLDPAKVAACYAKDAVLLPTVSDEARTTPDRIQDYFVDFLKKKPQGVITDGNIIMGNNWAQDAGIYEFTMGADGSKVQARYSFVYVYEDGEWKISHHHSSVMPEGALAAMGKVAELEAAAA